jgi:hypothetical protein
MHWEFLVGLCTFWKFLLGFCAFSEDPHWICALFEVNHEIFAQNPTRNFKKCTKLYEEIPKMHKITQGTSKMYTIP